MATYTQVDYPASFLPNVWERYYTMANGNVVTLTKVDTTNGAETPEVTYSVITHTEKPQDNSDWWDNVIKEVAYCNTLGEAEGVVAELLAA